MTSFYFVQFAWFIWIFWSCAFHYILTVGQRRWRTAVSHLPTWRPPKQANKATPGLVFYNRHTLHKCTHRLIWVGRIVCQIIAIYKALILSHGYFVFSAGGGGLVFKTTHAVEDSAYEAEDLLGGGGLCTWHRSLVLKWKQLLFALLNRGAFLWMYVVSFMIRKKHVIWLSSHQDAFAIYIGC